MTPLSLPDLRALLALHFGVALAALDGPDRHRSITLARHLAMWAARRFTGASFPEIGRAFGNRDHTTVMSAVRKIEAGRGLYPDVAAQVDGVKAALGVTLPQWRPGLRIAEPCP